MGYLGNQITTVFPTSISVDTATISTANISNQLTDANMASGSVLQVVSVDSSTQENTTSTSYVASSGVTASITPSSTSSKILTICSPSLRVYEDNGSNANMRFALSRDGGSNFLYQAILRNFDYGNSGALIDISISQTFLDSPSSTSALTYTMYVKIVGGDQVEINPDGNNKSTLTLMEIAG
tara:strand:- start:120 stop:665 length:546 start_codon:yes stop_codon:yes gene_type:complete